MDPSSSELDSRLRISDFGFVSLDRSATRQSALNPGPKSEIRNPQIRNSFL
jgi:hypothetical protein